MLGFNSWFGVHGLIVGWDDCEFVLSVVMLFDYVVCRLWVVLVGLLF